MSRSARGAYPAYVSTRDALSGQKPSDGSRHVFAVGVRRINTHYLVTRRVKRQFFQRPLHRRIVGMALDICIKLRGVEGAAQLIAFQLGHVHTIGGLSLIHISEPTRLLSSSYAVF